MDDTENFCVLAGPVFYQHKSVTTIIVVLEVRMVESHLRTYVRAFTLTLMDENRRSCYD